MYPAWLHPTTASEEQLEYVLTLIVCSYVLMVCSYLCQHCSDAHPNPSPPTTSRALVQQLQLQGRGCSRIRFARSMQEAGTQTRTALTSKEDVENDSHRPQVHSQPVPARVSTVPDYLRRNVPAGMVGDSAPSCRNVAACILLKQCNRPATCLSIVMHLGRGIPHSVLTLVAVL